MEEEKYLMGIDQYDKEDSTINVFIFSSAGATKHVFHFQKSFLVKSLVRNIKSRFKIKQEDIYYGGYSEWLL